MNNNNPFNVRLVSVTITKFNGSDKLEITPQVMEFTLYQSIFSPILRADMAITDYVGLMNNYPLSGEEIVDVVIEQKNDTGSGFGNLTKNLRFVISAIKDISYNDTARHTMYAIELASVEAFINAKTRVSHAYETDIQTMIQKVYDEYVRSVKVLKTYQGASIKSRKLVIPNLKPLDAINWLCKYAIDERGNYYTFAFYETIDNFIFKPLQKPTFRDAEDNAAFVEAEKERYIYVSNLENIINNQELYAKFLQDGYSDIRTINDLRINKRYTTLEKIVGGYYENELVEVNMLQKDHKITKSTINYNVDPRSRGRQGFGTLGGSAYNTNDYIKNIIDEFTEDETSSRVRYIVNNYEDLNQPSFRDKFGNSSRSFLAYKQIDLSAAVHSNLKNRAGDIMYIDIPEMHGFNITNKPDKYLSGYFLVTELKTVLQSGGYSQSYVRLNKDAFTNKLDEKSLYNLNVAVDRSQDRILNRASGV